MSGKSSSAILNPTSVSTAVMPSPLIQRKCACGKSAGVAGQCSQCSQEKLIGQTPPLIQPKLKISQPNDKYEKEADRVADMVMRMPDPTIQRQVNPEEKEEDEAIQPKRMGNPITPMIQRQAENQEEDEEETIQPKLIQNSISPLVQRQTENEDDDEEQVQLKSLNSISTIQRQEMGEEEDEEETIQPKLKANKITPLIQRQVEPGEEREEEEALQPQRVSTQVPTVTPDIQSGINRFRQSGGTPLPSSTRVFMESRFGHDFSNVRIYTGPTATELSRNINARAFTVGPDIFFNGDEFQPSNSSSMQLLAHELTHTIQQTYTSTSRPLPLHTKPKNKEPSRIFSGASPTHSHMVQEMIQRENAGSEEEPLSREDEIRLSRDSEGKVFATGVDDPKAAIISLYNFAIGEASVKPLHDDALVEINDMLLLLGPDKVRVVVTGHTSTTGSNTVNARLSERRAKAIVRKLQQSPSSVYVQWKGEEEPAISESTVKDRSRNRRVDIEFVRVVPLVVSERPPRDKSEEVDSSETEEEVSESKDNRKPNQETKKETETNSKEDPVTIRGPKRRIRKPPIRKPPRVSPFCLSHPIICGAIGGGFSALNVAAALIGGALFACLTNPTLCGIKGPPGDPDRDPDEDEPEEPVRVKFDPIDPAPTGIDRVPFQDTRQVSGIVIGKVTSPIRIGVLSTEPDSGKVRFSSPESGKLASDESLELNDEGGFHFQLFGVKQTKPGSDLLSLVAETANVVVGKSDDFGVSAIMERMRTKAFKRLRRFKGLVYVGEKTHSFHHSDVPGSKDEGELPELSENIFREEFEITKKTGALKGFGAEIQEFGTDGTKSPNEDLHGVPRDDLRQAAVREKKGEIEAKQVHFYIDNRLSPDPHPIEQSGFTIRHKLIHDMSRGPDCFSLQTRKWGQTQTVKGFHSDAGKGKVDEPPQKMPCGLPPKKKPPGAGPPGEKKGNKGIPVSPVVPRPFHDKPSEGGVFLSYNGGLPKNPLDKAAYAITFSYTTESGKHVTTIPVCISIEKDQITGHVATEETINVAPEGDEPVVLKKGVKITFDPNDLGPENPSPLSGLSC